MDYKNDIDQIIEKALTEKTFTLEIIDEIKKLRELPEKLQKASDQIDTLIKEKSQLTTIVTTLQSTNERVKKLEGELKIKERALELREVEFKWKDNLLNEYKNIMTLVFRNTTIRENRFGSVPVERNGYIETSNTTESVEKNAE